MSDQPNLFDVKGHAVIVTGAASGLGLAMTEALAEQGAKVMMADIAADNLAREARRLSERQYRVRPEVCDVGDERAVNALIDRAIGIWGRVDTVFANAGISAGPGPYTEKGTLDNVSMAEWDNVLRVNLTGVFMTIRAAAQPMKQQKSGRIIVTASSAGIRADKLVGYAYASTKAAVINLVRQAAVELAPFNVRVNGIAPGPFRTNIGGDRVGKNPDVAQTFIDKTLLKRIADPAELKGVALLLGSDASSFMTGVTIPVDGGTTAW
jgi:NAD(P)-dependent dehydrogenase (short-subunit alcohol dehydrogenase family)